MILISEIHQKVFDFLMEYHKADKGFLFVLRQLNRNARLEKGYWFLGNDDYVAVSFWMGKDDKTKSPRLSFIISLDGTTYLEINSRSNSKPFFTLDFFKELGFTTLDFNLIHRKYYTAFGNDYLSSLGSFLEKDKPLIDDFVGRRRLNEEDLLGQGGIDFIWPGTFEKQLRIVHGYQKILAEKERKTSYLRSFKVRNFGRIKNLEVKDIPEGCRWIFLTGENGAGKTSLLRALAAAISNNNDHGVEVAGNYKDFNVQIGLETISGVKRTTVKGSDDFREKAKLVKGFAAYGPVRLLSQGSLKDDFLDLDKNNISRLTTFGLFNPIGILRDISGSYVLSVKPKYYDMTLDDFLENIEQNLEVILPNIQKVNVVRSEVGRQIIYHQTIGNSEAMSEGVVFDQLPSGTRNFAGLILDLLLRFAEQQEGIADISNYVGVVLIDEIDLHLHPKMQKEIIVQLSETFPNIQFVVTTHSPIPMLGAPSNSIFINVHKDENHKICATKLDIDVTNLLPNTILTSPIFNFSELINEHHDHQERIITEDDFTDALFYKILEKKLRERNINPAS
ncbi:AAA family ATPase [Pedobacter sp. D749]|uniref:AAA family ATPase n=1 Tax=Pedobacter sp. D749 TaxID=2856523 RepID=UPI001C5A23EA|nr:AAA family ATPase [Pedobacter sp. D749]QXU44128.1 AAA family ATPase [Pedobacter sp. D749]